MIGMYLWRFPREHRSCPLDQKINMVFTIMGEIPMSQKSKFQGYHDFSYHIGHIVGDGSRNCL